MGVEHVSCLNAGRAPFYIAHFPSFGSSPFPVYPAPMGCTFGCPVLGMGPVMPPVVHAMPSQLVPFLQHGHMMDSYMLARPDHHPWSAPPRADMWRPMMPGPKARTQPLVPSALTCHGKSAHTREVCQP